MLHALFDHVSSPFSFELQAPDKPSSSGSCHQAGSIGKPFQLLPKPESSFAGMIEQAFVLDHVEDLQRHTAGDRVSAKGGTVRSWLKPGGYLLRGQHSANGHSGAERFGEGHDVRTYILLLKRKEGASSTTADLYLVQDQECASLFAELSEVGQEVLGGQDKSAFRLNWFDQDGTDGVVESPVHGVQVVELGIREPGQHGLEAIMVFGLARRTQSAKGAAMKGMFEGDDSGSFGLLSYFGRVSAGHLECSFVRFRAAVAQKDATLAEAICQRSAQ